MKIIIRIFIIVLLILPFNLVSISDSSKDSLQTNESRRAIERGLIYLMRSQNDDGSWDDGQNQEHVTGITAIAILAFLSNGHSYDKGPYGKHIKKGIDYILDKSAGRDGRLAQRRDVRPMYSHAFATLVLTEAYGMVKRKDLQLKLKDAVDLICKTQNSHGGWRYDPVINDDDISVSSSQIQALRAARDVGIAVPAEIMQKAAKYIKSCACPDGGFAYMPRRGQSGIARTGAGVLSLMACGEYECAEVKNGVKYLMKNIKPDSPWDYYGFYYGVQAMYQAGGEYWRTWFPQIRDSIIRSQNQDGSFRSINADSGSAKLKTSFAVIVLSVSNGLLPLFQR